MSCGNSDILALIDYFQNGTDLSNNNWDNYNYYDLWNAIENGATPPERTVCATFVQADIRSIVFAVLGVFTSPSDYLGENIDFYYLYLKAIGQEVVSPSFGNFCIGQLYNLFSIGLTAKFRQGQNFECTMSKVAAIASITFEQGQQLNALLSKSAALQNAVFEQQQTFSVDLTTYAYLLDDYSGAAAAYSVRLLSSTYSGPLVQIRKQGDNAINSFYPDSNNELSLNSKDISGTSLSSWIGIENGFVRTWYDQSGNSGRDVLQTTAANQPQIVNAGALITENGKATLDFDQTNDLLSTSGNFNFGLNTSIFGVFTPDVAATGFDVVCKLGTDSSGNRRTFALFSGDIYASAFANNLNLGAFTANTQYIGRQYAESNDQYGAINGASLTSGTFSLNNPPAGTITVGSSTLSEFFGGNIQEIIMYDSTQRTNDSGINTNLNNYYNAY